MPVPNLFLIAGKASPTADSVCQVLQDKWRYAQIKTWQDSLLPKEMVEGLNATPPPVLAIIDEHNIDQLMEQLTDFEKQQGGAAQRSSILYIADTSHIQALQAFIRCGDDYLNTQFSEAELELKVELLIHRNSENNKLEKRIREANDIALQSMFQSSEVGEIGRFILASYQCETYSDLLQNLFKTTNGFSLKCSALVFVDDDIHLACSDGAIQGDIKKRLLKHHNTQRITKLAPHVMISYTHGSIMIHDWPHGDSAQGGRIMDNLTMLCYCFDARIQGIDQEQNAAQVSRAKTLFLASLSQELRTPLNIVIGNSGRLSKKLEGRISDKEANQLDAIRRNSDNLLKMVNDILDLAKIEIGKMEMHIEPIDIKSLVQTLFDSLQPMALSKQLDFQYNPCQQDIMIDADPRRITQILMNLISNAIKYTDKGHVIIELSPLQHPEIGKGVQIDIEDSGIGIDEASRKRLFADFEKIDSAVMRSTEKAGLGLAISAFFAKRHRGQIKVQSEKNIGSCFSLLLPEKPYQV